MTDREKLIELLCDVCWGFEGDESGAADYLISHGVTFAKDTDVPSKWISVDDRLPAPMVSVITSRKFLDCETRESIIDYRFIDIGGGSMWYKDLLSWKSVVTHWMPLPQPPREE